MGGPVLVALFALSVQTPAVLRSTGCSQDDARVATLAPGLSLEVRFALDGACYKVVATVDGRPLEGYLPGTAIAGLEAFESARRGAPAAISTQSAAVPQAPAAPLGQVPALLDSNQPNAALDVLEAALQKTPRDPRLLAAAGYAAYRADNVRKALEYWREALDLAPDPNLEQLYLKVRREAAGDTSSEQKHGSRFLLRYDNASVDSDTARAIVGVLEEEFSRVAFELGCRTEERMVAIVQTREAYLKSTDAAEWSSGLYDGRLRVALVEKSFGAQTRRVFTHEIVHACLANLGRWPAWLHEGLAQRLSGEITPPAVRQQLQTALRANQIPKLDRASQNWSRMSARHAALAYALAREAVDLFYQHHAAFGIRNLLKNPQMLPSIADDLDRRLRQ